MSTAAREIVLLGATGYTGRLIAHRLDSSGIPFVIAVRREEKAGKLRGELRNPPAVRIVDATDAQQVGRLVDDAAVVINCVGPYNLYGDVVLEECRRRALVYVDLCGEQEFIRRSFAQSASVADGATVLHSIAFESALADLLAHELLPTDVFYRSVASYYSFAHSRPSPGTHLTMRLAPHFPTYHVEDGILTPAAPLSLEEPVDLGSEGATTAFFMPYPEVLFFGARYRTSDAGSYILVSSSEALFLRASRGRSAPAVDVILEQHARKSRQGPSEGERSRQEFTLTVHAVEADGRSHTARLAGRDMYGITAVLVHCVVEAVHAGAEIPTGVLAPSQLPVWGGLWERLAAEELISGPVELGPMKAPPPR